MAVLQLDDQLFPLSGDTTRIGAGADADVSLPGEAALGVQALIERSGDEVLVIRRAGAEAKVRVNGVLLGAEPTPLMHGDKVEVAGLELRFSDDSKRGATQYVRVVDGRPPESGPRRAATARPTAASGGRLVSLVDGKEYAVADDGLVIGRDAGCDVVVARNEVSRRHAEIAPTEQGYLVRDTSSNGVFVNGERVQGSRRLARSDVIRVGGEEFRFYADVLVPGAAPAVPDAATVSALSSEGAARGGTVATPAVRPAEVLPVPEEEVLPLLATLEVLNEGLTKGNRYVLRTPLAHVGRGAHNDVRLTDESVSETHAKLQRRDDGWYAVDMNSTNGTYVGGTRVTGERRLDGAPDVRFGGVKLRFIPAPADGAQPEIGGTRAVNAPDRQKLAAARPPIAEPATTPATSSRAWVWLVLAVAIGVAVFFVLRGRA